MCLFLRRVACGEAEKFLYKLLTSQPGADSFSLHLQGRPEEMLVNVTEFSSFSPRPTGTHQRQQNLLQWRGSSESSRREDGKRFFLLRPTALLSTGAATWTAPWRQLQLRGNECCYYRNLSREVLLLRMFKTRPDRTVAAAQQKMDGGGTSVASSFCRISLLLIGKLRDPWCCKLDVRLFNHCLPSHCSAAVSFFCALLCW